MTRFAPAQGSGYEVWTGKYKIINVKDFGAVGDGSTDDTSAFSNAVSAASGSKLVIPKGSFAIRPIASPLTFSDVIIEGGAPFNGSELIVQGPSVYAGTSAFGLLTNVVFRNLTISSVAINNYFSLFGDCQNVLFDDCIIQDCPSIFQIGGTKVKYSHCRFQTSSLSNMQCTIGAVTDELIVEYCNFNFAYSGGSGSIINVANNFQGPNIAIIKNNRIFDDDLPGYTVDAAIDIEPIGSAAIEHCEIEGNTIFNSKIYVSGISHGIIKDNTFRTTTNGLANGTSPITGYNNYSPIPPSGYIEISGNRIIQDNVVTTYAAQPISWNVGGEVNRLLIKDNDIQVNASATGGGYGGTLPSAIIIAGINPIADLEIKNNHLTLTADLNVDYPVINLFVVGTLNLAMVRIEDNYVFGGFSAGKFVQAQSNSVGGLIGKVYIDKNDVSNLSILAAFFSTYQATVSELFTRDNVGYNPIGSQTPTVIPFVSGTVYQNNYNVPITIYQPAYATVAPTAGTVAVAIGPTNTPTAIYTQQISGGSISTQPDIVAPLRVPAGWYYSFTASGATLLTANIQGE